MSPAATAFLYNSSFYQITPLSVVITPSDPTLGLRVNGWPQIFVLNNTISSFCPSSISHWSGSLHPGSLFLVASLCFLVFCVFACLLACFVLFHFSLQVVTISPFTYLFFKFYFIFKLYNILLVLPNIKMNPPQVYLCSPS